MPDDLRRRAVERVGHPANLYRVIRHQPVTALEQLNGRLALADTAVTQDQYALSVDIHQDAVPRDLRGRYPVQVVNEPAGDIHRGVHRPQQRAVVLVRHLHQLRRRLHIPRHDHRRERIAHQLVEHTQTLCLGHALQIAYLAPSQYLQALVVKIIVKAYQLQGGPIHVGNGDHRAVIVAAAVQYFHTEGLHHFFQAGGCAFHFFHGRSSCPETGEYTSFNYILRSAFSQHFPHAKKIRFFVK